MNEEKNTPQNDWQKREVGALWKKKSATQPYLAGHVNIGDSKVKIVIFTNKFKDTDAKPDYRIYLAKEAGQDNTATANNTTANNSTASFSKKQIDNPDEEILA
jgi:uncharacterized protein (DUF736 family)